MIRRRLPIDESLNLTLAVFGRLKNLKSIYRLSIFWTLVIKSNLGVLNRA